MVVSNLTTALAPRGIEFVLAHPRMKAYGDHTLPFPGRLREMDFQWEERSPGLKRRLQRQMHRAKVLRGVIREEQPDLVLSSFSLALHQVVCLLKLTGLRESAVVRFGRPMSTDAVPRDALSKFSLRLGLQRMQALVANSRGTADDVSTTLRVPRDRIEVIPNPLPLAEIQRKSLEDPPNLPDDEVPLLLNVGRLSSEKNQLLLLRAFRRVRDALPSRLLLVGGGPLEESCRKLVADLQLEGDVHFLGWQSNPYAYMRRASLFVLSSDYEGFGNVLVEAMACGCPVIATACGGGPEDVIGNDEYGVLTPIGDEAAMAERILNLLRSENRLAELRTQGLSRAQEFDSSEVSERYLALFLKAMGKRAL